MFGLKRSSSNAVELTATEKVDTIHVALKFAPNSFYVDQNGNLAGLDYQSLRKANRPLSLHPVSDVYAALRGLDSGRYNVVIGTVSAEPNHFVLQSLDSIRCQPWVFLVSDTMLIQLFSEGK